MLTGTGLPGEARLRYLDAEYEEIKPGRFVICAVTGQRIPLEELRYWSVDHQEAYVDAEAAFTQWKRHHGVDNAAD